MSRTYLCMYIFKLNVEIIIGAKSLNVYRPTSFITCEVSHTQTATVIEFHEPRLRLTRRFTTMSIANI